MKDGTPGLALSICLTAVEKQIVKPATSITSTASGFKTVRRDKTSTIVSIHAVNQMLLYCFEGVGATESESRTRTSNDSHTDGSRDEKALPGLPRYNVSHKSVHDDCHLSESTLNEADKKPMTELPHGRLISA